MRCSAAPEDVLPFCRDKGQGLLVLMGSIGKGVSQGGAQGQQSFLVCNKCTTT